MAPVTFYLASLGSPAATDGFIAALKNLAPEQRPIWAGECHHWIHEPSLSVEALTGAGDSVQEWTHLVVFRENTGFPAEAAAHTSSTWSITADVQDLWLDSLSTKKATFASEPQPELPDGWSASNHDAIDAAQTVDGVELSLHSTSHAFGASKAEPGQPLKTVIRDLGIAHPGPVAMFNLLSYLPGQRERYFGYIAAFQELIGPKFGGQGLLLGLGASDWSSRAAELERGEEGWEDLALVWYPSVWHFGKMLDDPMYADLDRRFKGGVLRNNPLVCCTELELF